MTTWSAGILPAIVHRARWRGDPRPSTRPEVRNFAPKITSRCRLGFAAGCEARALPRRTVSRKALGCALGADLVLK
ncbi:MAG: hypothetical protein ACREBG_23615, partial [Pyrinomonadaceae bacterium]